MRELGAGNAKRRGGSSIGFNKGTAGGRRRIMSSENLKSERESNLSSVCCMMATSNLFRCGFALLPNLPEPTPIGQKVANRSYSTKVDGPRLNSSVRPLADAGMERRTGVCPPPDSLAL
jgi:hypothetical protein